MIRGIHLLTLFDAICNFDDCRNDVLKELNADKESDGDAFEEIEPSNMD